jgi:hypothetical protein
LPQHLCKTNANQDAAGGDGASFKLAASAATASLIIGLVLGQQEKGANRFTRLLTFASFHKEFALRMKRTEESFSGWLGCSNGSIEFKRTIKMDGITSTI